MLQTHMSVLRGKLEPVYWNPKWFPLEKWVVREL